MASRLEPLVCHCSSPSIWLWQLRPVARSSSSESVPQQVPHVRHKPKTAPVLSWLTLVYDKTGAPVAVHTQNHFICADVSLPYSCSLGMNATLLTRCVKVLCFPAKVSSFTML